MCTLFCPQKIYYIENCFSDEKIRNYKKKFNSIENQISNLIFISNYNSNITEPKFNEKIVVKSNISKNKFIQNVMKAKKYIKIGDIFQVVLSQRFECKLIKKPIEIYKKLRTFPKKKIHVCRLSQASRYE